VAEKDDTYRRRMIVNHLIIHGNSVTAAGSAAGLAQVPGGDEAALTAITTSMVGSLCGNYKVLSAGLVLTYLAIISGGLLGKVGVSYLYRFVPFLGNAINAGVTLTLNEAQGWLIVVLLERGIYSRDELRKRDIDKLKQEGRKMREEAKKFTSSDEFKDSLKDLKKEVDELKKQARTVQKVES
jgi:uncharacterized protein (DUF697 family)